MLSLWATISTGVGFGHAIQFFCEKHKCSKCRLSFFIGYHGSLNWRESVEYIKFVQFVCDGMHPCLFNFLRLAWRMNVFLDGAGVAAALLAGFFVVVVGSA